ncbi:MAG TPA: homocysteine S-methyltransferase family protein, partial [Anaerolineae bacterium]
MDRLTKLLESRPYILGDGAMGTMLHQAGLTSGGAPEEWNVTHADAVRAIYQGYRDAGSQVITTNTFGGNRYRLALHNMQDRVAELNQAGARLAHEVAGDQALVAGDMGPTGEILFPLGTLTEEDARAAFAEQARALAKGGIDFFLIETMSSLEEVQAAVEGIRSVSDLPIAVTMTFDTRLHTMMGVSPKKAVQTIAAMGVRVIGANCGNGPAETEQVAAQMAAVRPEGVYL